MEMTTICLQYPLWLLPGPDAQCSLQFVLYFYMFLFCIFCFILHLSCIFVFISYLFDICGSVYEVEVQYSHVEIILSRPGHLYVLIIIIIHVQSRHCDTSLSLCFLPL